MEGVTIRQLVDAVRAGDLVGVRSMVAARPELVHFDVAEHDEHQALHHAVLTRHPDVVRFLMQQGADARKGIWPHRGATSAFTLAFERGDDDIARIIQEEEERRRSNQPASVSAPAAAPAAPIAARRPVSEAVALDRADLLTQLLESGHDADEAGRVEGLEEIVPTWGGPLRACALTGRTHLAEVLLAHGAKPNTNVYAASSALYEAYARGDEAMRALLERHGGRLNAVSVAELGLVDHAAALLADTAADASVATDLLWGAIESPSPDIVKLALTAIDWPRDDARWHGILENGLYLDPTSDRARHLYAFRLVLDRCDPDARSRRGTTVLHEIAASRGGLDARDRVAYASLLLDRGARLDVRDQLLQSTPLGWACRWGRLEMVTLLLDRGADPVEAGAERWATPVAWARKMGHGEIAARLERFRAPGA
jgi:hypothetical protein